MTHGACGHGKHELHQTLESESGDSKRCCAHSLGYNRVLENPPLECHEAREDGNADAQNELRRLCEAFLRAMRHHARKGHESEKERPNEHGSRIGPLHAPVGKRHWGQCVSKE